jgi:hypothetical protein
VVNSPAKAASSSGKMAATPAESNELPDINLEMTHYGTGFAPSIF